MSNDQTIRDTLRSPRRLLSLLPSAALMLVAVALALVALLPRRAAQHSLAAEPDAKKRLDPAAWGSDHVGQPLPRYVEGGECLFCHRNEVGGTWQTNRHNLTIRAPEADSPAVNALKRDAATTPFADEVELLLGNTHAQRFLRRSKDYGKVDILTPVATFGRGRRARLKATDNPHWDDETFELRCAGCHATAVRPESHAFSTVALDCYPCHGDGQEDHTNDTTLMPLAKARKDPAEVVTSICASCHIRNGKSKSTGLPYPNNFVAGDNLFKDFQVDFRAADDEKLNPGDRHVLVNVRDVVVEGRKDVTCLTCHEVHAGSSKKHRDVAVDHSCTLCHEPGEPIKGHKDYDVHSECCQY